MTEVEQWVRDRVRVSGEPCLLLPPGCAPSLLAVPLWKLFEGEREGVYVLATGDGMPDTDEAWASATFDALATVRLWCAEPAEGTTYSYEEGAVDVIQRVECTALGLSLLQLALNRTGAGIAIECNREVMP